MSTNRPSRRVRASRHPAASARRDRVRLRTVILRVQEMPGRYLVNSASVSGLPVTLHMRHVSKRARARLAAKLGGTVNNDTIETQTRDGCVVVPPDGAGYARVTILGRTYAPCAVPRAVEQALRAINPALAHQKLRAIGNQQRLVRQRIELERRMLKSTLRLARSAKGARRRQARVDIATHRAAIREGSRTLRKANGTLARIYAALPIAVARALAIAGYYHGPLKKVDARALEEAILDYRITENLAYSSEFRSDDFLTRLLSEAKS